MFSLFTAQRTFRDVYNRYALNRRRDDNHLSVVSKYHFHNPNSILANDNLTISKSQAVVWSKNILCMRSYNDFELKQKVYRIVQIHNELVIANLYYYCDIQIKFYCQEMCRLLEYVNKYSFPNAEIGAVRETRDIFYKQIIIPEYKKLV